jgi:predicted  nucleic acid-binding Zn-ribbon protein
MTQSISDELVKIFFQFILPALILAIPSAYFSYKSYLSANKSMSAKLPVEVDKLKADTEKTEVETLTIIIDRLREHILSLEVQINSLSSEIQLLHNRLEDCLSSKSHSRDENGMVE